MVKGVVGAEAWAKEARVVSEDTGLVGVVEERVGSEKVVADVEVMDLGCLEKGEVVEEEVDYWE